MRHIEYHPELPKETIQSKYPTQKENRSIFILKGSTTFESLKISMDTTNLHVCYKMMRTELKKSAKYRSGNSNKNVSNLGDDTNHLHKQYFSDHVDYSWPEFSSHCQNMKQRGQLSQEIPAR